MEIFDNLIEQVQTFEKANLLSEENNPNSFNWYHSNPSLNNRKGRKQFEIKVTELRPFTFNNSRNLWVWFKNLVVPTIRLNLVMNNVNSKSAQNNQKNIANQLYTKTICLKKLENNQFEEVILNGKISEKFSKDMCLIQGIKYSETTFVSRSQYFRMVILVSQGKKVEEITNIEELEDIIISPPIYVEARQKFWLARQSSCENYDPFPNEIIEKKYEYYSKQSNEKIMLGDDISSLYNYFQNPYIRHKSINPLFLSLKFPNALNMYFNRALIPKEHLDENQQIINKNFLIYYQKMVYQIIDSNETIPNSPFILFCLNENTENSIHPEYEALAQKITSFLSPLSSSVLIYQPKLPSPIPSQYIKLSNIEDMKVAYKLQQNILDKMKLSRTHQNQKQDSDCEQSSNKNYSQDKNEINNKMKKENNNSDRCCTCYGIMNSQNKKRSLSEFIQNQDNHNLDGKCNSSKQVYSSICIDLTCRDILQKKVKLTIPVYSSEEAQLRSSSERKKSISINKQNVDTSSKKKRQLSINLLKQQQEESDINNCMSTNQEEVNGSDSAISQNKSSFLFNNSLNNISSERSVSESQGILSDQKSLIHNLCNRKVQSFEGLEKIIPQDNNNIQTYPSTNNSNNVQMINADLRQFQLNLQQQQQQELQNKLQHCLLMQLNPHLQMNSNFQGQSIDYTKLYQLQQLQSSQLNQLNNQSQQQQLLSLQ